MGAQQLGFAPLQPLQAYPWQAYVHPSDGHLPMPGMHGVTGPSTALCRGSIMLLNCAPAIPLIWWIYSFGGSAVSHLMPLPSLHGRDGSSFPGLSAADVNSESVVGIQPGDSGMMTGNQVDELTHTWFSEQFVAHSHVYFGFIGKASSLNHSPLEPSYEDNSFLDQEVADS